MSGHSKWSTIKHQKGAADARRGQLFTKLSRDIAMAVKHGGGPDPDLNFRLRLAIDKARSGNMPMDTIDRAIGRSSGGSDEDKLEEVIYEGYGPGGTAIMLLALTSNRNRTASEIRTAFSRSNGNLGEGGCVSWNFESKGVIASEVGRDRIEDIALQAIDAGAEDVNIDGHSIEIYTQPESLQAVRKELESLDIPTMSVELSMIPKSTVRLGQDEAEQNLKLLDSLEDLLDVQKVYSNADFPDEVLEKYSKQG